MRKIWDWIVALISKVPYDKLLHFIAGLLAVAIFVGIAKEAFDWATTKKVEWLDLLATAIGGLIIQAFVLLG